jgi:sulfide:quinone oxidoreductase
VKTLLILGAGTGGTLVANKMARRLDLREWQIIVVDRDERHLYQPGLLFIPFGGIPRRMSSNRSGAFCPAG